MPAVEPAEPSTYFTTHDREQLVVVATTIGFIKETLTDIKTGMATAASNTRDDKKDLEARIRVLENFRWWIVGISASASVAGELLFKYFGKP